MRVFQDIPDFPGYRTANDGSVWSCWNWGGSGSSRGAMGVKWHRLKPKVDKDGYLKVALHKDGKVYHRFVHRLVLESFVGPCPPGMQACHYPDQDPANCRIGNLRWDTWYGNLEDRKKHGTHAFGEKLPFSKLKEADIKSIRFLYASGMRQVDIASQFNVASTNVSAIVRRATWRHVL